MNKPNQKIQHWKHGHLEKPWEFGANPCKFKFYFDQHISASNDIPFLTNSAFWVTMETYWNGKWLRAILNRNKNLVVSETTEKSKHLHETQSLGGKEKLEKQKFCHESVIVIWRMSINAIWMIAHRIEFMRNC